MKNYITFVKKELISEVKTYRLLIVLGIFMLMAFISAPSAKFLPELVNSMMTEGMKIPFATPAIIDSWGQFFKNISQIGVIATMIIYCGIITSELNKGTLIPMFTKGLSRTSVIMSKFTSVSIMWTAGYWSAFFINVLYSALLFPGESVENLFVSVLMLWMYGIFLISTIIFASSFTKGSFMNLLIAGGIHFILILLSILPPLYKYNPLSLSIVNMQILSGDIIFTDILWSLVICVGFTGLFIWGAVVLFSKKQV